jgi:3'-phosphoadenosine 5'-phosphosulfate sulfotransferase (PAPS reductase)/FAD synthetase
MSENLSTPLSKNEVRKHNESFFSQATPADVQRWNAELRARSPLEIVRWAVAQARGRAIVSTNFRPYEAAILHLAVQHSPTSRFCGSTTAITGQRLISMPKSCARG